MSSEHIIPPCPPLIPPSLPHSPSPLPYRDDVHLRVPSLSAGQYSFAGEARGFDGETYRSSMELQLQVGGAVAGEEKGKVLRGPCVSGQISQGRWGVDGKLDLDYVFQDGTVFVYTGVVDMGHCRLFGPTMHLNPGP